MPTLTGTIQLYGARLQTALEFTTVDAPRKLGGWIESAGVLRISTDSDGHFSVAMPAGQYRVKWDAAHVTNSDQFTLPAIDGTYDLSALIAGAPPANLEQWINQAALALAEIYPRFATMVQAQAATITAYRVDVIEDGNTVPEGGTFIRNASYGGALDGVNGFADAMGSKFQRWQRK